ncbi:hypothetical protein QJS10_CPA01g02833 [Acorus calamus]|uniref:Myb-like domain-containing protein n=1 Tax=Acorus calamus TaxID=4465 RepID=A0AAV9FUP8_ACOCL|nr:hypothetical protein QJS10_CPA01g02833 [Acorus calamus]
MSASSSPSVPLLPHPLPPPKPPSSRRPPPPCWTQEETLALIESYRDERHSLRRGSLRAADWQSVADSVSERCCQDPPSKTATQCRHKMEKLRKRYRSDKQKRPTSSSWVFFRLMDSMEIGPVIKNSASAAAPPKRGFVSSSDDDSCDDHNPLPPMGFDGGGYSSPSPPPPPLSRRMRGGDELAAAMGMLMDGYVRMERVKMEAAKEMEKRRMEMELKHTELIVDSYRYIVDSVRNGLLGDRKRARLSETRRSSLDF